VTRHRRPSPQTVAVLRALADRPATWRHGYELGQEVGLRAGSLYPILIRLRDRDLLEAVWEADPPPGRPPRHLYRLTDAGNKLAAEFAAQPTPAETAQARTETTDAASPGRRRGEPRGAW